MTSLELLREIDAWLSFNVSPSKEQTKELQKSIRNHVYALENDSKNLMLTVWKDGTHKLWSDKDAYYAENDPNWLTNISINDCFLSLVTLSPYNPAHGCMNADCCGIFNVLNDRTNMFFRIDAHQLMKRSC